MTSIDALARRVNRVETVIDPRRVVSVLHEVGSDKYTVLDSTGARLTRTELSTRYAKHEIIIREYPAGYLGDI